MSEKKEMTTCDWCNDDISACETFNVQGDVICEECKDDNAFMCHGCGELFHCEDSYTCDISNYNWCEQCFNDNYFQCSYCDEWNASGDTCNCSESESGLSNIERDFTREPMSGDTFGVELEAECGDYTALGKTCPKACGIHSDGSLSDNGVEVVTPPMTTTLLEEYLHGVVNSLSGAGFKATERTGLHVHVGINVDDMTIERHNGKEKKLLNKTERKAEVIKELVRIMEVVEPIIYAMQPVSRLTGRWCAPIKQRSDEITKKLNERLTLADFYGADSRYHGLNLCALKKYGTVEFRYHSGSVDYKKIMHWVQLIELLVRSAKRRATGKQKSLVSTIARTPSILAKASTLLYGIGAQKELCEYVAERIKKHYPKHIEYGTLRNF